MARRPISSRSSRSIETGASASQRAVISAPRRINRAPSRVLPSAAQSRSMASGGAAEPECSVIAKSTPQTLLGVGPGGLTHDPVSILGPGSAHGDHVQPLGSRFEGSHDLGRDAHDIPLAELTRLVIQQHPPGPGDDNIGLLLLAMTVGDGTA